MLALDDKKWSLLSHAYGKADDVPEMILELEESFEKGEEIDLLYGYLCHQNTTYSATFAAVPHIVEIAFQSNTTPKHQADIVIFCGLVHSSRNYDKRYKIASDDKDLIAELNKQIENNYSMAIEKITPIAENLLNEDQLNEEDKWLSFFSRLAFHKQEKLSYMFFQNCNLDEFVFNCIDCKNEIYLWAENNEMVAYIEDPVSNKNTRKFEITPIEIDWRGWNGEFSDEHKAEWILFLAEKYDIEPLKYQIPYLFSEMICPHCSRSINIINSLIK